MLTDQITKATHDGDVNWYRLVSLRMDLWRNITEFGQRRVCGSTNGCLPTRPTIAQIQAEMAIALLTENEIPEDRRDVIERFPAVATPDGLRIIEGMLEMLSFNNASHAEYNRYYDVKRLINRCIEVGVDRALAELS